MSGRQFEKNLAADVFDCVISMARAAPNLRQALQCLVEFFPLSVSPECELELVNINDVVEFRWRSQVGIGEDGRTEYHGLKIMINTLQMLCRKNFQPEYARFVCSIKNEFFEPIRNSLDCHVLENSEYNAIALHRDLLDMSLSSSNQLSFTILHQGLVQLRDSLKGDFVEKVRGYVQRELSSGHCTVGDCANSLRTSTRTLQQRLYRSGIKFSTIVLDERIKLAKHALVWSDYCLDEIAFQLGYTEQASFGRAFKKATGETPKAYRFNQRHKH